MRVHAVMLGFNTPEVIEEAMENFEATTSDYEHRRLVKTLFILSYPRGDVAENNRRTVEIGAKHGWWTTFLENKGVMPNWNTVIHDYLHLRQGDFLVTFDPDVRMQKAGWISAMLEVMAYDPKIAFVCAAHESVVNPAIPTERGRRIETLPSGLRIGRYRSLIAWSMGMWRGEVLASRPRDFSAKSNTQHYGYVEHADFDRIRDMGLTWVELPDYVDTHAPRWNDPLYAEWKNACGRKEMSLSFEQFVAQRKV